MPVLPWRRLLIGGLCSLLALLIGLIVYVSDFDLDRAPPANPEASRDQLSFLASGIEHRGRVLTVVSSAARLSNGRRGGYELSELARAYWVFVANGYAVDIASPGGGEPLAVIDDDDITDADHAFLNDAEATAKRTDTLRLADVDASAYAAVFFVGGKGAMVDFPGDPDIARIVAHVLARDGVVGAVCHGPAALVGLRGGDGRPLLAGRRVTAFTNDEELFLISNAREVFPFLLQERLQQDGAEFVEGPMYLDNSVRDGAFVTGQNPWSTWSTAETMIHALGHAPVPRPITAEERAVQVLAAYRRAGFDAARAQRAATPEADVRLLLMHALVAAMRGELHDAFQLQRLARG